MVGTLERARQTANGKRVGMVAEEAMGAGMELVCVRVCVCVCRKEWGGLAGREREHASC